MYVSPSFRRFADDYSDSLIVPRGANVADVEAGDAAGPGLSSSLMQESSDEVKPSLGAGAETGGKQDGVQEQGGDQPET